ncbi:MAG: ADP-ribosylglycohydrolase family protein [Clostridia bacterium]|nr:ADP-ribosylglycohydrolase family protein [Clostridia bacterium]
MWGAIIGDIVGSRFEFNNHKSKIFDFFGDDCFFTDDTVMTIAIAKALSENEGKTSEELKNSVIYEMSSFAYKYQDAGYGNMFYNFLFYNPVPYNSFGNGAAMRISAAGESCNSLEEVKKISRVVTEVSHNHPEGIKGAECVAVCIYLARTGSAKEEIKIHVIENYYPEVKSMTCDGIRPDYVFDETCQRTVPQALTCFFEGDDFEGVIRNAISIGGDSDTIGAIAGSVAEAFYGVPDKMIQTVREKYLSKDLLNTIDKIIKYKEVQIMRKIMEYPYPLNLAADIIGDEPEYDFCGDKAKLLCENAEFISDYEAMICSLNDEKLEAFVVKTYKELKDFDDVAAELNCTKDELKNEIYPKVLRKLRHPSRSKFWWKYLNI